MMTLKFQYLFGMMPWRSYANYGNGGTMLVNSLNATVPLY